MTDASQSLNTECNEEEGKEESGSTQLLVLLPPFLHVVLDEFFCVRFEHVVDFIDQLIDVFFQFLAGFDDLRIGLDLFLPLRLSPRFLLALLFLHPSTSHGSGKLSWISHQRHPVRLPYPTILSAVKPRQQS